MNGPLLGSYLTRADALTAETEWLTQNWLRRQGVQNDRFDYFDLIG